MQLFIRWRGHLGHGFCLLALMLWLGASAAQSPAPSGSAPASPQHRRVVILMGTDAALPAMRQFDDAFRKSLLTDSPSGVTFFTDSLDMQRFDYANIVPEFLLLERKKYARQQVDLVVGVGDGTVDFLRDHAGDIWPDAPLLLAAADEARIDLAKLPAATATQMWRFDIDGTLGLVERLQPAAKRLIIIGGSTEFDRSLVARIKQSAEARARWSLEIWDRFSVDELRGRVAALDPGSAVMFASMLRDGHGVATFSADAVARLAQTSGAPIYGLYGTVVERGATAGNVVDFADMGRNAARHALALLNGQPAPAPGATPRAATRCVADYRQLQAHGLAASRLPPGCELLNPPRNLWTEYRAFVLTAVAVVLLQALTIGALLLQQRRRRKAEAEALLRRTELARAMRFAAMGELTASIAHEINQPLGAILSNADAAAMLLRAGTATSEQLQEILSDIRRDDLRAHEVIRRLRALLEKHEVEQTEVSLHAALNEVLLLLEPEARRRGVSIERRFEASADGLLGDAIQLQQVLLNLALNAMDAMQHTAPDARRLSIGTADRGDDIELTVTDRGTGIDAARRDSVFDSFYTTKPHGMGLGLSIVRAIVEAHHGHITVEARDGGGTVFCVRLPRRLHTTAALASEPFPVLAERA